MRLAHSLSNGATWPWLSPEGRSTSSPPAPFVSEDSVYGYIIATLNDAQNDLTTAGSTPFPFPVPSGFSGFDTPAGFIAFNRALAAKAYLYRATAASSSCGPTACYTAALAALAAAGPAFSLGDATQFKTGVEEFSSRRTASCA